MIALKALYSRFCLGAEIAVIFTFCKIPKLNEALLKLTDSISFGLYLQHKRCRSGRRRRRHQQTLLIASLVTFFITGFVPLLIRT